MPVCPTGFLVVTVTASGPTGNLQRQTLTLQVVDLNAPLPPSRPNERPQVVTAGLFPAENARDVNVFDLPRVGFTEPLANVGPTTLFLRPQGGTALAAGEIAGGSPLLHHQRGPGAASLVTLRPRQNLRFNTTYELVATNALVDLDPGGERLTDAPEQVLSRFTTEVLTLTGRLGTAFAKDEALFDASRLFVLDRDLGLLTVDIAIRTQPRLLATTPVLGFNLGGHQALALGRDFLYADATDTLQRSPIAVVAGWDSSALEGVRGHLRVFDVSNPDAPQLIGRLQLSDHTGGVPMRVLVVRKETPAGTQHFALVGEITAGVVVVDLQRVVQDTLHPEQSAATGGTQIPALVGLFSIPGGLPANPAGLVPYRGDALYLDVAHGLFRLDLSNLPAIRGTLLDTIPSAYRLTVVEDYQVGTDALNQPILKDFAIVGTVTAVTLVDLGTGQRGGTVALSPGDVTTGLAANPRQGLVFVAAAGGGFKVIDIRDPDRPALLGGLPAADTQGRPVVGVTGGGITQDGIYAYLTSGPDGLQIVKCDLCCVQILVDVRNQQHYAEQGQHAVLYINHNTDPPTMPRVFLKARLVDNTPARAPLRFEGREFHVQWNVALRYAVRVLVDPRRSHDETFTWTSRLVPVREDEGSEAVRIAWDEFRSPQSGQLTPFVGGGELRVQALLFPSPQGTEPANVHSRSVEVDDGLTLISDWTGPTAGYRPYTQSMSPGSPTLRIEGQLAHVVRAGGKSQPAFKLDAALKPALVDYLQRPGGVAFLAEQIRDDVTDPVTDPQAVIRTNLFRLIAFKETRIRHFNDLTLDGAAAVRTRVPSEAVWPILNTIGAPDLPAEGIPDTRQTDGGFGIMQLTGGGPTYRQIWEYRENIDEGIRRLNAGLVTALAHVQGLRSQGLLVPKDLVRQEMYLRYNAGPNVRTPLLERIPGTTKVRARSNVPYVRTLVDLELRLLDGTLPAAEWGSPSQ